MTPNRLQRPKSQDDILSHGWSSTSSTCPDKQHGCNVDHEGASHKHHQSSGTCCLRSLDPDESSWLNDLGEITDLSRDVERGPPNFERVVLSIDGLQCGCCEGGISRTIDRISAIRNHQLNVVLARLELELDTNHLSVTDVIRRLKSKTGYTFVEQVAPAGQILELVTSAPTTIQDAGTPFGVTCMEFPFQEQPWHASLTLGGCNSTTLSGDETCQRSRSTILRVHYVAEDIGARDIFEYYQKFDESLRLAAPAAHPSLAMGARQTNQASKYFVAALSCTLPVVVLAWAPVNHTNISYSHVSLALATVVQVIAFKEFVPTALRSLWHAHVFEMDFLIALSSGLAYAFSVISYALQIMGRPLETGCFFETSTLLVTLILLGRVINEFARYRAAKSVSFRSLQADDALLVLPNSPNPADPRTRTIDARLLQYGDHFKIAPHTRIVTDGIILFGGSEVDESMITGESIPVAKGVHSKVFAGTMNGGGALVAKLTALTHENSVHKIAALVENAELTKPRTQALADRIAGWFVPAIATIGTFVFLGWLIYERYDMKGSWRVAIVRALTFAIATLVVSCPCAIGLAVPMVILIAGGVAARFGVIFRDPQKLEVARNVTDIVFDKTGTLTCGVLTVVSEDLQGVHAGKVKGTLLSLLQNVQHPVAIGVLRHLEREASLDPIEVIPIVNMSSISGSGIRGTCAQSKLEVHAGHPDWLDVAVDDTRCTLMCVTIDGELSATFKLKDRARHTAAVVIEKLHERGIHTHMISGDGQGAVDDIAHTLGITKPNTKARCTPEGKMNYVKDLQQPGKIVMFVGDGTNDSVALKQADVGVHINQSSDVAKSAADIVLMTTRLHDILILLDISRAAYRRIIVNFIWAAMYNLAAVLLASGVLTKAMKSARISPEYAGLGELVSVLPVVLIAFQMRWVNWGKRYRDIEYDYLRVDEPMQQSVVRTRSQYSSEAAEEKRWMCSPMRRLRRVDSAMVEPKQASKQFKVVRDISSSEGSL
ncbi:E1-E2 ATPase-domain-containing protein [Paraphoma chrysanthemicola]|uniref:E1-E2 ATPase-domain-containing protein n=1 Tax=Paraphoma chrysanthemicola TaxID=798071 RepID=A0A8K0VRR5_9PLEO|nr:E1-E2 ATPase-domain-containing protein [Paraphoma chrysanthemicola]